MATKQATASALLETTTTTGAAAWRALGARFGPETIVLQDSDGRLLWLTSGRVMGWQLNPYSGKPMVLSQSVNVELVEGASIIQVQDIENQPGIVWDLIEGAQLAYGFAPVPMLDMCENRALECEQSAAELHALIAELTGKPTD